MSENSKIEWCDHTFNPWVGCAKISPACDHCYSEGWAKRSGQVVWSGDRKRTSIANWRLPLKWNEQAAVRQHGWEICVSMHPDGEAAAIAAGYIKPTRPKVFCASLADVFDNQVPVQWRMDLFSLIADTPHLDWLILTKRIGNVMSMCSGDSLMFDMIGERVWLGATICNQTEADRDIPKLLAVPAAKRFLSMEPLLGAVDLTSHLWGRATPCADCPKDADCDCGFMPRNEMPDEPQISWVIVGGESGPNARPMHPDWARSLRDQCDAAGVPFLFKQWGEWTTATANMGVGDGLMSRVGKKAAGRLLDGREWNGVPA